MSRLMTLKQIQAEKLPVANSRFYEWLAAGQMPKPVKVGKRNLWPEHEIDGWLQELIGRRDRGEMALPMSRRMSACLKRPALSRRSAVAAGHGRIRPGD